MQKVYKTLLLLFLNALLAVRGEPSVHILSENLEQLITSSTLEWIPSSGNDETILKDAVIASYQIINVTKAETENDETEQVENGLMQKPIYVCRAKINSVWVSGQLRPKKYVCIVSLYKKVTEYKQFEILINIEGSSRLSWVHKDKYTLIPQGAVTSGSGGDTHKTFIARRKVDDFNNEDGSLTYNVGKFLPNENLGVFHFVNQSNKELQFEDGEILVETEPIQYEFKNIKFDRYPRRYPKKKIVLGQTTLKNEEHGLQLVESVIGYKYKYYLYWGKGHGLLTGLPFTVFLRNGTQIKSQWALPEEKLVDDVAGVRKNLDEGTAVNVTLIGNYTESEEPYTATVICIYKDGERRDLTIRDTKREHNMLDIVAVYDREYFLNNNSYVPARRTTSTTTTTPSSTLKITSPTQEVIPMTPPDNLSNKIETDRPTNTKPNGSMMSDDHVDRGEPSLMKEPNGVSSYKIFSLLTILVSPLVILQVT